MVENLVCLKLMLFAPVRCRVRTRMGQTDVYFVQLMLKLL